MMRTRRITEADVATGSARTAIALVSVALLVLPAMVRVHEALAVPALSMPAGAPLESMEVLLVARAPEPSVDRIEHVVEHSDYEVDAPPEPKLELQPEPEPQVAPEPEPEPQPEIKPESKPKPAPRAQRAKPKAPVKAASHTKARSDEQASGQAEQATDTRGAGAADSGAVRASSQSVAKEGSPAYGAMLERIVQTIQAHKHYPRRARQTGQEGTVVVAVDVNAAGCVTQVRVDKKAASAQLNRAALTAAQALVGMSVAQGVGAVTVRVPVIFTLTGA